MRIAIFENEYQQVEAAFEAVNLLYFNNKLEYEIFPSSQSIGDIEKISLYDAVIVDIDLSQNSQLDGYALLANIEKLSKKPKILILTGSSKVGFALSQKNFPPYDILMKPIDFTEVHNSLNKVLAIA